MPGANCAIFGCPTSRKTKGISIHKVPAGEDDFNKTWREQLICIITKDRTVDQSLKSQIESKQLFICELHFHESCLLRHEKRTTLIPKSLPTLNLPVKSFSKAPTQERSTSSIEKRTSAASKVTATSQTSVINLFQISFKKSQNNILCYNWLTPEKNELLTKHNSSLKFTTLSTLISEVENFVICEGVSYNTDKVITHTIL